MVSQPTARYLITEVDYQRWVFTRPDRGQLLPRDAAAGAPVAPPARGSLGELRAIEREAA